MKNTFKKISAVIGSVLMVGMTMGVAAAANYPAPFVVGGSADAAIVYGTGVGVNPSDLVQAGYVQTNLASATSSTGGTPTGDNIILDRTSDRFNLQNNMSSFYSKLDEGELKVILAQGTYVNDAHNDFPYDQEITLGPGIQLTHFLDSKFNGDKPVIGFDLAKGTHLMNYSLKFTPTYAEGVDSSWSGITDSEMSLLGKSYYVLSMTNTTTGAKITLLNAATSATLNDGESTTLTTATGSYAVSVAYLDNTNVKLTINSDTTDSLIAGETQKLSDGSYVGIKSLNSQNYAGGIAYVEFSIGSGKLVLENSKEVEINSEKLSKTEYPVVGSDELVTYKVTSWITIDGWDVDEILLDWEVNDDSWIAPGTEMTLPGFETIKLSMNEFVTSVGEITKLSGDSNRFEIDTVITNGAITIPLFYLNSSSTGIAGLGKSLTEEMATGNGTAGSYNTPIQVALNGTRGNFFVVTWIDGNDAETYAYELESVDEDSKNKTVLNNLAADGSDMTLSEVDQYETEGNVKISLGYAEENHDSDEFVLLNITSVSSGGKVYLNRLVTKDGLMITLPYENSTWNYFWANGAGYDYGTQLTSGAFNSSNCGLTSNNANSSLGTAWSMNVTEEDKSDNIGAGGKSLTINFVISGTDGLEPSSVGNGLTSTTMFESEDDSKLYIGYMPTDMSTKVKHYKPTSGLNDLELTYFGDQTYAEVFVTDASSVMTGGSSLGEILVKDTEVSSMSSKNLIVVGGSCINSAAATLLGGAKCEADFTTATGVGAGQFLIQSFGDAYTTGKIALLVAGYETADTMNAVTYLRTNTVDTTASKKYIGTSGTEATLQVS